MKILQKPFTIIWCTNILVIQFIKSSAQEFKVNIHEKVKHINNQLLNAFKKTKLNKVVFPKLFDFTAGQRLEI